jgi:hypothetical protein
VKIEESSGPSGLGSPSEYSPVAPAGFPTSSRGISCAFPSTDVPPERPLPHTPFGPCFGSEGTTLEILFRPRGFTPPRRFPPLGGRGLVASRCQSWGSSRFPANAVPATNITPLEGFPSTAAAPRHRGRCPLAVPPDPARHLRPPPLPDAAFNAPLDPGVDFEALLRRRVRNARPTVANRETSCPSWASFPSKVLPGDETSRISPTSLEAPADPEGSTVLSSSSASRQSSPASPEGAPTTGKHSRRRSADGPRTGDHTAEAAGPGPDADENPSADSRRRSLSGAEVRDVASPRPPPVARFREQGRHRRPSWGF